MKTSYVIGTVIGAAIAAGATVYSNVRKFKTPVNTIQSEQETPVIKETEPDGKPNKIIKFGEMVVNGETLRDFCGSTKEECGKCTGIDLNSVNTSELLKYVQNRERNLLRILPDAIRVAAEDNSGIPEGKELEDYINDMRTKVVKAFLDDPWSKELVRQWVRIPDIPSDYVSVMVDIAYDKILPPYVRDCAETMLDGGL